MSKDTELRKILEPVLDWFQSDEEDERPTEDVLREVVQTLQEDRRDLLDLQQKLRYILQADLNNRQTPRIVDIGFAAFMRAKGKNEEDGGPADWSNDTLPDVMVMIEEIKRDLLGIPLKEGGGAV